MTSADGQLAGLRKQLQAIGDFFSKQRHLVAVRDGVVGALPLILIGSIFLIAAQPPSEALQRWVAPYVPTLLVPYRMLGGLVAVYVAFSCAHSLARSYELDPMASGLLAMAVYFVAAAPSPLPSLVGPPAIPVLPIPRLGAGGIFAALLLAIGTVELTKFFVRRNWTIRLPQSAPPIVVRSFIALLPGLAMVVLTFAIVHIAKVDLVSLLERGARPLLVASASLPAALAVVCVDSSLWVLGVHASAALATMKPFWETTLLENAQAAMRGDAILPNIATQHFYLWFVWQGGSGATLPLALHLLRARSAQLKGIGRAAIIPSIFNINEPIVFGAPIVLNPQLAIPFFAAPLVSALTAYMAFSLNWVRRPYLELPWTLPAPLGALASTGGDPRALFLELFNLALGLLIYWPFVRRYDARLAAQEAAKGPPAQ